jgi:hypothetical protein
MCELPVYATEVKFYRDVLGIAYETGSRFGQLISVRVRFSGTSKLYHRSVYGASYSHVYSIASV